MREGRRIPALVWGGLGALLLAGAGVGYYAYQKHQEKLHEEAIRAGCQKDDIAACSELCHRVPSDLEACLRLGKTFSSGPADQRDEGRAARLFAKVCEARDANGCAYYARALYNGQGIDRDVVRAGKEFKFACDQGNALGCAGYGHLLLLGSGSIKRDIKQATQLFERACSAGEQRGCASLGLSYLNGQGVDRDLKKAFELFDRACRDDIGRGCLGKAMMLFEGVGVPRDEKLAVELFDKACKGDTKDACASLGAAYLTGRGATADAKKGLELTLSACDKAPPAGCVVAAELYSSGQILPPDPKKAESFLRRACDFGQVEGCAALGHAMATGMLGFDRNEKNTAEGAKMLREGCERDENPMACGQLAALELAGLPGIGGDAKQGLERAENSCKGGYPLACTVAGSAIVQQALPQPVPGQPLPSQSTAKPELTRAAGLFQMGCDAGDPNGCAYFAAALLDGQGIAKDLARGKTLLETSCEKQSSPQGCAMLSRALLMGMPPFDDQKKGVQLAESLCVQGDPTSCMLAAGAHADGRGVKRDMERATRLVVYACTGGFEPACKTKERLPDKALTARLEREMAEQLEKAKAMASSAAVPSAGLPPGASFLPPPR